MTLEQYTKKLLKQAMDDCDFNVEIKEIATGKVGIAAAKNSRVTNVNVWYGETDGSDDKTLTFEDFNNSFIITRTWKD